MPLGSDALNVTLSELAWKPLAGPAPHRGPVGSLMVGLADSLTVTATPYSAAHAAWRVPPVPHPIEAVHVIPIDRLDAWPTGAGPNASIPEPKGPPTRQLSAGKANVHVSIVEPSADTEGDQLLSPYAPRYRRSSNLVMVVPGAAVKVHPAWAPSGALLPAISLSVAYRPVSC